MLKNTHYTSIKHKLQLGVVSWASSLVWGASVAHAQNQDNLGFIILPKGFAQNLPDYMNMLLSLVIVIASLLVFFQLIYAGFLWITSGGDKGKTEQARARMISAIVGILIVAASYAILLLVLNFLGFGDLNELLNTGPLN